MTSPAELSDILGPTGQVSGVHPNYEFRPGQIKMAQAVGKAIDARHHLCVEAGTGTGKTLAYLLPCISSSKRVIISTGTKNLQEQIFFKDIPFLLCQGTQQLPVPEETGRNRGRGILVFPPRP